ncbi:MAG: Coenzyme F420 hydrogenase/dehydrogenase, beta subunit C-terminal domain [Candidatus Thorarchaeota archaeon]
MSFDLLKEQVIDKGLCEGCGLCAGTCKSIVMENGTPKLVGKCILTRGADNCGRCYDICPQAHPEKVPAKIEKPLVITSLRAKDEKFLEGVTNGGFVPAFLAFLLKEGDIKAVPAVVGEKYKHEAVIVTDPDEMIKTAGTKYSPTGIMTKFLEYAKKTRANMAVIGLPCELRGVSLWEKKLSMKVLKIGLFCTNNMRKDEDGKTSKMGSCDHCTDFIGVHADISCGFAGSPKGFTTVIALTEKGKEALQKALDAGIFEVGEPDFTKVEAAQARKAKRVPAEIEKPLREKVLEHLSEKGSADTLTLAEDLNADSALVHYHLLVLQQLGAIEYQENPTDPYSLKWTVIQ